MNQHLTVSILGLLALSGCDSAKTPNNTRTSTGRTVPNTTQTKTNTTQTKSNTTQTKSNNTPSEVSKPAKIDIPAVQTVVAAAPADSAVAASNNFGLALYQQMKHSPGNLTFSPASISLALAMTYAGAKSDTAAQMHSALRFPKDDSKLHGGWATLINSWQSSKDVQISVANRLFGDKKYSFEAPFLALTRRSYGAPLLPVDFAGAPEKQRLRINRWVAQQTRDRITGLIPPTGVDADTRMALVNAIYFKGKWDQPFRKNLTSDEDFNLDGGGKVKAPMMSNISHADYAEIGGAKLAQLRYKGRRFATLFVLPPKGKKMADFESKLDAALLGKWVKALKGERTWLKLPRFTIKPGAPVELSKPLKTMGMKLPFDRARADFSAMTKPKNPDDRLFVKEVYHKAFVAMDEAGTEAAAATAVVMARAGGMPAEPKKFHANRPFLFFIRDATTGLVIFAGRVLDPTK